MKCPPSICFTGVEKFWLSAHGKLAMFWTLSVRPSLTSSPAPSPCLACIAEQRLLYHHLKISHQETHTQRLRNSFCCTVSKFPIRVHKSFSSSLRARIGLDETIMPLRIHTFASSPSNLTSRWHLVHSLEIFVTGLQFSLELLWMTRIFLRPERRAVSCKVFRQ